MYMHIPKSADPAGPCSSSGTLMHVPTQWGPKAAHRLLGRKLIPAFLSFQVPMCNSRHKKLQIRIRGCSLYLLLQYWYIV